MRKLIVLLVLLYASPAVAQTAIPTVNWEYEKSQLTTIQGYAQSVKVDGVTIPGPVACVQSGADVACAVAVPGATVAKHTIELTAIAGGVGKVFSAISDPAAGPQDPKGLRFTFTTVTTTTTTVQVSGR